jgi:2-polyprenyl-3-methyl-5-hydroxy-6-metoxy-1,4-benzoquinol methylase
MNNKLKTKEPQYHILNEVIEKHGLTSFGLMANESWNQDPKRTLFTLSRYKFVAKMFSGMKNILEIGCADAFGTRIVQQHVEVITAVDFDPVFIEDIENRYNKNWPFEFFVHDMLQSPIQRNFDAAYCLDVLEHIKPSDEALFIKNICQSLNPNGVFIAGMPSLESQKYASPQSKAGHVNCKSGLDFKKLLENHFHNVFLFSMNDEVVHTGYSPMAQYLLVLCAGKK